MRFQYRQISPGFGLINGVFSFLILSATKSREILAHAPLAPIPGTHASQLNGLRPIRVALRLLGLGIGSMFRPESIVSFRIGKFTLEDAQSVTEYATDYNFRRLIKLSGNQLRSGDVIRCYVVTNDGPVEVGPNKYNEHGNMWEGVARKVPVDPNF